MEDVKARGVVILCGLIALCGSGCSLPLPITTTPSGAYVYLNGALVGKTPYSVKLDDNSLTLDVYLPGYTPVSLTHEQIQRFQTGILLTLVPTTARGASSGSTRRLTWIQLKIAVNAGRAGDCGTVGKLDVEVRKLDAAFHDAVFAQETTIAHCLVTLAGPGGTAP